MLKKHKNRYFIEVRGLGLVLGVDENKNDQEDYIHFCILTFY
mgnify:CR=1 FL=1